MARLSQPSDKQGLNVQILTIVLCIFPGWYYIIFPALSSKQRPEHGMKEL